MTLYIKLRNMHHKTVKAKVKLNASYRNGHGSFLPRRCLMYKNIILYRGFQSSRHRQSASIGFRNSAAGCNQREEY